MKQCVTEDEDTSGRTTLNWNIPTSPSVQALPFHLQDSSPANQFPLNPCIILTPYIIILPLFVFFEAQILIFSLKEMRVH